MAGEGKAHHSPSSSCAAVASTSRAAASPPFPPGAGLLAGPADTLEYAATVLSLRRARRSCLGAGSAALGLEFRRWELKAPMLVQPVSMFNPGSRDRFRGASRWVLSLEARPAEDVDAVAGDAWECGVFGRTVAP